MSRSFRLVEGNQRWRYIDVEDILLTHAALYCFPGIPGSGVPGSLVKIVHVDRKGETVTICPPRTRDWIVVPLRQFLGEEASEFGLFVLPVPAST